MELKNLVHQTIKEIINNRTPIILNLEGFSTYHDLSDQRTCELTPYFCHNNLDTFPILLSVIRKDYVAISDRNFAKAIEHKSIEHIKATSDDLYIGVLSITEEMVNDSKIELRKDGGTISLKGLEMKFINNY